MSAVKMVVSLPPRLYTRGKLALHAGGPWLCDPPPPCPWAWVVGLVAGLACFTVSRSAGVGGVVGALLWGVGHWVVVRHRQRAKVCPDCLTAVSRDARCCCWCGFRG